MPKSLFKIQGNLLQRTRFYLRAWLSFDRENHINRWKESGCWNSGEICLPWPPPLEYADLLEKIDRTKCVFPYCEIPATDAHHIQYTPPMVAMLCREHHKEITVCNINFSRKYGSRRKLSNKMRWKVWNEWLAGHRHPCMSPAAKEWLSTWKY